MCDARLLDGSRVNVAVRPVAIDGPLVSIRKFSKKPFNLNKLVEVGALRPQMAELLAAAVKARVTLIISGGTGSGKTTMLNALSAFISEKERLLTIEDAAELQLQQPHVGRMETRPPNIEGKGEIRQRDLVKNALRMRPDRVILGECRGEEAFDMLQAMNTGHEGSMATVHANTPRDAISRLEQMIGMAGPADDGRRDPRPDRRRHPRHRAAVAAVRRQAPGHEHRRDHRARGRHHPDAGNLQIRAHRHRAGRRRAGPLPGHRRAPALSRRSRRRWASRFPAPISIRRSRSDRRHACSTFDPIYLIWLFVAVSAGARVEAVYLMCFQAASYRSQINRRLMLSKDTHDRESVLIELRRERGLTAAAITGSISSRSTG